eukprot:7383677-Prymnesium_polylepis.1
MEGSDNAPLFSNCCSPRKPGDKFFPCAARGRTPRSHGCSQLRSLPADSWLRSPLAGASTASTGLLHCRNVAQLDTVCSICVMVQRCLCDGCTEGTGVASARQCMLSWDTPDGPIGAKCGLTRRPVEPAQSSVGGCCSFALRGWTERHRASGTGCAVSIRERERESERTTPHDSSHGHAALRACPICGCPIWDFLCVPA